MTTSRHRLEVARRYAQKTAAFLGGVAGSIRGVSSIVADAEMGGMASIVGASLGLISGVILIGLLGSASGCSADSVIGEAVDRGHGFCCPACGYEFGECRD